MIFLYVLTLILAYAIYSWISLIIDAKKLGVPGPFPLPILGNTHLFFGGGESMLPTLGKLKEKYGKISRYFLLSNRYILVSDLKFVEAVCTNTEHLTKGRSYDFFLPWLGNGLLVSIGQRWKTHRRFLTPAFHFSILQNFMPIFQKNTKILIEKLRPLANGSEIEFFEPMALTALDNVGECVMGVPLNTQLESESKYVKAITSITDAIAFRIRNGLASQDVIFNLTRQKKIFDDALKIVHQHSKQVIEMRKKQLETIDVKKLNDDMAHGIKNKNLFLDLLLLAEVDGRKIDVERVKEEVDTFMFEGHDTTSSGMVFALYCLAKHSEVQEKVFREQKEILGDDLNKEPTYSEYQQMKYLDLVIKESLRLFPPVCIIERFITRDTEFAGTVVPKNTTIVVDIRHLQLDPEIYDNPLEFRPERFETQLKNPFAWIPFSAGPRNCIGQKFAFLEMKVVVSAMVRQFKILPSTKQTKLCLAPELILRDRNGLFLQLQPRS